MATILAAGPAVAGAPAAKSGDAGPGVALPADSCFDHVDVVLNNKPQRAPASTAYMPETQSPDVRAILVLSLEQARPCSAYSPIDDMSAPRPAAWVFGSDEESSAPPGGSGQAWLAVEAPRAAPPSFALRLSPTGLPSDAIVSDAAPIGELAVGGGFVLADSLLRGRASGDGSSGLAAAPASAAEGPVFGLGSTAGPPASDPSETPGLTAPTPPGGAPGTVGDPSGVPEPATWLMLAAGVFGLGAALRHRPRRLAT